MKLMHWLRTLCFRGTPSENEESEREANRAYLKDEERKQLAEARELLERIEAQLEDTLQQRRARKHS